MPATVPPDATATGSLPPTCCVKNWVVFWPGIHKDEYYGPDRCKTIAPNFKVLVNRTPRAKLGDEIPTGSTPRGKLGHDPNQLLAERLKQSSGMISVGDVTRADEVPGYPGHVEIDVRNVPTRLVGGEIAAGRYNSGSIEIKSNVRDPRDPSKVLPGVVLTAIAFLGEEPPALNECHPDLQARTRPRATFDDGRPVPANPEPPAELVAAMSDVMRTVAQKFSGEFDQAKRRLRIKGREFTADTVCFSDFNPDAPTMTPEQEAALQAAGFTPEQIAAMKAALPQAGAAAVPPPPVPDATMAAKPGDAGDKPPPWFSAEMKKFSDELGEVKKHQGELSAFAEASQKKECDSQMAAFGAHYEPKVAALVRKASPVEIEKIIRPALANFAAAKTFSAETDRYKAADEFLATYERRAEDPKLASLAKGAPLATPEAREPTPFLAKLAGPGSFLDTHAGTAKKLAVA